MARNMDTRRGETDARQARGYPSGMKEAAARRSRFPVSVLRTYGRKRPRGGGHPDPGAERIIDADMWVRMSLFVPEGVLVGPVTAPWYRWECTWVCIIQRR